MTGLEKILKAIEEDARAQADTRLEAARKEAAQIMDEAKAQGELRSEEISRQSAVDAAGALARAQSAADLLKRRTLLLQKAGAHRPSDRQRLHSLFELSDERYFDVLLGMANKYAEKQSGKSPSMKGTSAGCPPILK